MKRLSLKEKPFQNFKPAEDGEIDDIWQQCLKIEQTLQVSDALLLCSFSKVILTIGMLCSVMFNCQHITCTHMSILITFQRNHLTAKDVKDLTNLSEFLKHCCFKGHYCFQVRKCDKNECTISRSVI